MNVTSARGLAITAAALSALAAVLHPLPETEQSLATGRNTLAHVLIGVVVLLVGYLAACLPPRGLPWQRAAAVLVAAAGGTLVAQAVAVGQVADSDLSLAKELETSPSTAGTLAIGLIAVSAVVALAGLLWRTPTAPRVAAVLIVLGVVASAVVGNIGSALLCIGLVLLARRVEAPERATA